MAEMKKFEELKNNVIHDGGYFVHYYFDMHSQNAEGLQNIMTGFVAKLTKEPGVRMAVAEVDQPLKRDDTFSTTAKVSMLISDFTTLTRLTMSYTPIAIEVEEPLDAKIDAGELQGALMGISGTTQHFTQHIMEKGMDEGQKKKFEDIMKRKAEFGKKIRDKTMSQEKEGEEKKD